MLRSIVISAVVAVSIQGERVLELTPKSASDAGSHTFRDEVDCRTRGTGRIAPAPALSLTIAALDRLEYSLGEQFVADLRVKNTGKARVVFPSVLSQDFGGGAPHTPGPMGFEKQPWRHVS